jgi:hypothetical protein
MQRPAQRTVLGSATPPATSPYLSLSLVHGQRPECGFQLPAHLRNVDAQLTKHLGCVLSNRPCGVHDARDRRPRAWQVQPALAQHRRGRVRAVREHAEQQMLIAEVGVAEAAPLSLGQPHDLLTGRGGTLRRL